ncbi:uncharacterized protein ACLA_064110 [Aspergillus clavatus NRRL 1]|uniref:Dynamin N-terminal domain-containing protein n=1 Tax=Aspergillus clavatus (strain ATCC 1007 / CBS 513.65 / DSM 816 / NCTC 3887 / NRRL 1 / QM 1276 / 107) TaxID=344612 RepID=A1CD33_ASPCL|nr:uncharacterized protein ACLA_064110 [Aspergillus clavatus NRRL 1]EAW12440.1 hypothetical protein ACLA_064110 [Aspergillus clavatus NRRL 1]
MSLPSLRPVDANAINFHDNVKSKRPDEPLTPNTFWVGVLHDSKTILTADYGADILWIKCRSHTKIEAIKKQCRLRSIDPQPILLRHNGLIVDSTRTIGELDSFFDGVIALESIKQSDLVSRTSPPQRDPLQPLSTLAPVDARNVQPESLVKPEPQNWPPDHENLIPPLKTFGPGTLCKQESPVSLPTPSQTIQTFHAIPAGSHDFLAECARRDFIHERLTDIFHGCVHSDVSIEHHRKELVAKWQIMLPEAREWYRKRALLFTRANNASMTLFTNQNAGFYQYFFPRKSVYAVYMDIHGPDQAFITMKQDWDRLNTASRSIWIEKGRKMRHNQLPPLLSTDPPSVRTPDTPPPLHGNKPHTPLPAADQPEPKVLPQLSLQSLFAESTPELLEAAMQQGVKLLEDLKEPLGRVAIEDASQWLRAIEKVQSQAAQPKTIVGVVGNTGAGKSSVINAMLDEERLVPTNCMRACTAVVTEISYNTADDPYRAEIEFITRADWERELRVLFQDLFDGSGNVSREATNEESEAGVAYAKIKAVYPKFTREMLQKSTVEQLMAHPNVQNVLGGKRQIAESDSLPFYKKLQYFVDSKEKTTGEKDKDKKKPARELEFWPLIKVVRLYVKAEALSTGAVIVDLPGVHDSNAARSAVAEGYMKQCTGLWIVAPITRAVDDKAAKSLLGDTFKRQLKMDGGFNTVTFICSKTDDISLIECQESLGLEEEIGAH